MRELFSRPGRLWANQVLVVKGLVVVALPLFVLMGALLSLYFASRAEARAEADVRAAFAIQSDIHEVHALLAEAASGVRGYLLTGQPRFLEPYIKAEGQLPATFARLDGEIHDEEVRRRFDNVRTLAQLKRNGLAALRQAPGAGSSDALERPEVLSALVANKRVLDALRSEIEAMQARESALLDQRRARADTVRSRNLGLTAIIGALGLLGSLAAVYLFSTGIVRRVQLLEANAERLERGETLEALPLEADEIGRLGARLQHASHLLRSREQALRDGEQRFRLVVEGVKDYGIFALDPNGCVISWNEGAERIKGWQANDIVGRHFSIFYPDETRSSLPSAMLARAVTEGRAEDEGWRLRHDGSRFWANVIVTALRDEEGCLKGFSKVTRDMTDRKDAERALSEARETAIAASLAKSDFVSRTSHELRTPLSAILGFAQMLELDEADLNPPHAAALQHILKAGRHLLALINEVLDISSIEAGRMELAFETIDLRDAVVEALDLASPLAAAAGVRLTHDLSPAPVLALADRRRIVQIVLNLLSNAIKYNALGGVAHVTLSIVDGRATTEVWDEGTGIKQTATSRLFTPFDRLDRERTSDIEGTGLGLALSKRLAEAMGGRIGFENRAPPDHGARFWFMLPLPNGAPLPQKTL